MIWQKTAPVSPVSVDELKTHLHIDDDFEDSLLSQYLLTATGDAEHTMQREVIKRNDDQALAESADDVPPAVKQYVMVLAGDFFTHREMSGEKALSQYHVHLLDPFILWNRDEEGE